MNDAIALQTLLETRENYRARRGFLSRLLGWDRIPKLPSYRKDELSEFWRYQDGLLNHGKIVWSALIQANNQLFVLGDSHLPGEVVCSSDQYFDAQPDALSRIASRISLLKHTHPEDPELAIVAATITDELYRAFGNEIPMTLTEGRKVSRYTLIFYRPHLPYGHIRGSLLPVLFFETCPVAMLLPGKYWAQSLLNDWRPTEDEMRELRESARAEQDRRRSGPALVVTRQAADQLRATMEQVGGDASQFYVRIEIKNGEKKLDLDERKRSGDVEVTVHGIWFLMDRETAQKHWGLSIDFDGSPGRNGFVINE